MQIVLHTGAHFTDEERLLRSLLRNTETLASRGTMIPGPSTYRPLLRKTFSALREGRPSPDAREVLLDAILNGADADRMVLSNPHFFGIARAVFRHGLLYPLAPERLAILRDIFRYDEIEVCMSLRNPATLLPQLFGVSQRDSFGAFLGDADPREVRWSDTIGMIRAAAPNVPLTLWCYEDTPLLWEQILREIAGTEPGTEIAGAYDLLHSIMTTEGFARFQKYLAAHPNMTEVQRRRVIAAFLDKFAIGEEMEEEVDLPGWNEALVEELTEIYEDDMHRLDRMPGVTLLTP